MIYLEEGEKLIAEVRRHWFIIFSEGLILFLLAIGPVVVYGLFKIFINIDFDINIGGNLFFFFAFIYLVFVLIIWVIFFVQWTNYYLDVWYLTDKRIIDIEQKGLFRREKISIRYDRIQDVTIEVSGMVATLAGYGDIHVQSAGIGREIILRSAASPDKIKKIITGLQNESLDKTHKVFIKDNK